MIQKLVNLEIEKFYAFKYLYNGKAVDGQGIFKKQMNGLLYFQDNYEWVIVRPDRITLINNTK